MEYVKNGEIVLSISQQATRNLTFGNDIIQFSARFNGVSREISVPISAVQGIFARENGQGMFFDPEQFPNSSDAAPAASPTLHTVPNGPHIVAFEPDEGGGEDEQGPPDKPKAPPRGKLRVIK
jgi:stringent starvation protein B